MAFKKSSKCQAEWCVEVDVELFQRSSKCRDAHCVEVAAGVPVLVRDSKLPDTAPMLAFSPQAWAVFTSTLRP